jgi:hypothetical protein
MQVKRRFGLFGVVAIGLLVAGCGSSSDDPPASSGGSGDDKPVDRVLFDSDFEGVCSGAPQAAAAAYDKATAGIHPVLGFGSSTLNSDANKLLPLTIPEGFTRKWAQGQNNLAEVQLVVCAKRIKDTVVKTCDGYQKDGKDTGQKVTLHNASYELKLFAAKTGEELAAKAIDVNADDCPSFVTSDTTDHYPSVDEAVVAFVQPMVKTDA